MVMERVAGAPGHVGVREAPPGGTSSTPHVCCATCAAIGLDATEPDSKDPPQMTLRRRRRLASRGLQAVGATSHGCSVILMDVARQAPLRIVHAPPQDVKCRPLPSG